MMNKTYAIYLPAEGEPKMIEFGGQNLNLDWYYEKLGCEYIDFVRSNLLKEMKIVIDDEGWLKDDPKLNIIASVLYGAAEHGQTLVGNAMLCDTQLTPNGEELTGMPEDVATSIMERLEGVSKLLRMI